MRYTTNMGSGEIDHDRRGVEMMVIVGNDPTIPIAGLEASEPMGLSENRVYSQ